MKMLLELKDAYLERMATNRIFNEQIDKNSTECIGLKEDLELGIESLSFLEEVAIGRRNSVKDKIENVITEALQVVYGDRYRIELVYQVKNNRSFMDIELIKPSKKGEIRRDMGGYGGGVADTISVPLRLLILLGNKKTNRVCILDEAYKHVDPARIENVGPFLKEIANRLNIQIIICTHHSTIRGQSDNVFEITLDEVNSVSMVKGIKGKI